LLEQVRALTGARAVRSPRAVQRLWGGYGEILRVELSGAELPSVIVKHVEPPAATREETGSEERSRLRKLRSYEVEMAFYERYQPRCDAHCRVPRPLLSTATPAGFLFVLEDLDQAGFAARRSVVTPRELEACLGWLARFHARFVGVAPDGLWTQGTYWHLATRPDELANVRDQALREAAPGVAQRLAACSHRTLLHGDAKLENFCFAADGLRVAAVDFQYTGGGAGIQDVAYLLGCALTPSSCERSAPGFVNCYFEALRLALAQLAPAHDVDALESEWRALEPYAWADFHRFLAGWSPEEARHDAYGRRMFERVARQRVA
jgi:hypothetical protein